MKTLDYDAAGMPVSASVEYSARCQLLDLAARCGDGHKFWLFVEPDDVGVCEWRGASPINRELTMVFVATTQKEDGVVEIVEFKPA